MADTEPSDVHLDPGTAAGGRAAEAFSVLGNDTRLSILLALWESLEPLAEGSAVPFSELRERVGMRDSGQFNYHLDQLTGHFVRQTDDGYVLRGPGKKLVRAVIAGTGIGETNLPPTTLHTACHRCGAEEIEISYREETLYLTCPECEGFISGDEFPDGTLAIWEFDAAGVGHRAPPEMLVAGAITERRRIQMMQAGVCPDCSGSVTETLQLCEDHSTSSGGVCPNCGTLDSARILYECAVCKNWNGGPAQLIVTDHPALISFYYDRGFDVRYDVDDVDAFDRIWHLFWEQDHTLVSTDPVRIRVTAPCDGDQLTMLLDEELEVIEIGTNEGR